MELHIPTPQKKDYRQDEKALKEWVEVTYPAIVKQAREENAEIWWLDETGVRNTSNYVKGYAPKGETPTVRVASAHIGVKSETKYALHQMNTCIAKLTALRQPKKMYRRGLCRIRQRY